MTLKISCIQSDIIAQQPAANRKHLDNLIDKIDCDTEIILLPETFTTGFPAEPEQFAEDNDGDTLKWMKEKATERNCIICGTLITKFNDTYHNSLIWMTPDGSYRTYNKRHPFSMGGEENIVQGTDLVSIKYKEWKIRPFVCYDLRFPVWSRNRVQNKEFDYDIALYLANWPEKKAYVFNQLLIARAIENQSFIIGVNRIGKDHRGISYIGGTQTIDFKGRIIKAAADNKEEAITAILNKEEQDSFRNYFTVSHDWDDFTLEF